MYIQHEQHVHACCVKFYMEHNEREDMQGGEGVRRVNESSREGGREER